MGAITTKGQVTIPKRVRDALGVKPGDHVSFELLPGGEARLRAVNGERGHPDRWAPFVGCAGTGLSTDNIMQMTRGEPD